MTRRQRKRPQPQISIDVAADIKQVAGDLLVAQCRLAALEGKVPYEDLVFCRRLIATVSTQLNELLSDR